jgi:hypothetical protein
MSNEVTKVSQSVLKAVCMIFRALGNLVARLRIPLKEAVEARAEEQEPTFRKGSVTPEDQKFMSNAYRSVKLELLAEITRNKLASEEYAERCLDEAASLLAYLPPKVKHAPREITGRAYILTSRIIGIVTGYGVAGKEQATLLRDTAKLLGKVASGDLTAKQLSEHPAVKAAAKPSKPSKPAKPAKPANVVTLPAPAPAPAQAAA